MTPWKTANEFPNEFSSHAFFGILRSIVLLCLMCLSLSPALVAQEPADTNYDESKVPAYSLPKLLVDQSGQWVDLESWLAYRRGEVLRLFEQAVYGKTPERQLSVRYEVIESDSTVFGGIATRKQVAMFFGPDEYRIDVLLYTPNQLEKPAPCFLGLNFEGNQTVAFDDKILSRTSKAERGSRESRWQIEKVIQRGYAIATVHRDQIDPDNYRHDFTDGIHPLFYTDGQQKPKADEWGAIGAWAWGLSRTLDYLESDDDVDASKVAVIGHSRLGKTALWAAAQDERFAIAISNNSGCGGAALYRRCYGERIHHMMKPVGYWFCRNHAKYQRQENELPVDQHMLIALLAPRPVYVASATQDQWADPKGEFLSAKYASPVYELFDLPTLGDAEMPQDEKPYHTTLGYHLRAGKHDMTWYDWQQYLTFADRHLKERMSAE